MTDSDDIRIQRMGLVPLPKEDDNAIDDEDFDSRKSLHDKLKDSNMMDKKIFSGAKTAFETSEYTGDGQCVPCYLPVPILVINGTWPNKISRSKDDRNTLESGEEVTMAMEEAAMWCKEYATYDIIKGRDMMQNMKVASSPETYSVPDYNEHLSSHVVNAEEKYKRAYFALKTGEHKCLKLEHITIEYKVLQCNFPIRRDSEASQHYKKVHLLKNGANELKKREVITVNTNLEFKIEDLTHFESSGPIKQSTILDSIYTHVISRGIFEAGSSKNGAELHKSMAKKFMDGMKSACKGTYYDRFRYSLKTIIKKEVDDNFSCSWENIESAIYAAVGQENKVKRMHGFNKIKASNFHSKPMEIIIADIDEKINEVWGDSQILYKSKNGKTISFYSFCLIYKYTLILGVVENLGSDFGQVKDVIEQEITSMIEKPTTLVEIPDFQKKLVQEFTTRHVILTFRNKEVPKPKQANVNTGEISEKKQNSENNDIHKEEYNRMKKPMLKDWETAKELADTIKGITNDENKNLNLLNVPAISTWLKERKWRICAQCMSSNCQLSQWISRKNDLPIKYLGPCTGKPITVGDIPETIKNIEKMVERSKKNAEHAKKRYKKKEGTASGTNNTTEIEAKSSNYNNDPDEFFKYNSDILENNHFRQSEVTSARLCPVELSTLPELDEDTLPNIRDLDKNGRFNCYVCGKPNMKLRRYDMHLCQKHSCDISNPDVEEYACARAGFEISYEKMTPEQRDKAYWNYDSEKDMKHSDVESSDDSGDENHKNENIKKKAEQKHSTGYNSSGNSSSSSSNNSQKSQRKKRTKRKNNSQKLHSDDSFNNEKSKKNEVF